MSRREQACSGRTWSPLIPTEGTLNLMHLPPAATTTYASSVQRPAESGYSGLPGSWQRRILTALPGQCAWRTPKHTVVAGALICKREQRHLLQLMLHRPLAANTALKAPNFDSGTGSGSPVSEGCVLAPAGRPSTPCQGFDQTSWLCMHGCEAVENAEAGVLHCSSQTGTDCPIVDLEAGQCGLMLALAPYF